MKKKVSLKDIASKVGVSTALVSYVLNNKKSGRIRKEVAQKIKETAVELNYRTNQIARSLKLKKTFTIGLIVADISNPFFSSMARIIEDEANKKNYTVIFGSADENADKSFKLINALLDRQVDGFIIAPAENAESNAMYLKNHDIPFVLIDRYFPELETNWVSLDNHKAAYTGVQHLIRGGNTRTGLVTYHTNLYNLQERKRGYEDAMKANEILVNKTWIKEILFVNNMKHLVEEAVSDLLSLSVPVDSILFTSNILAMYGLKYIHAKGIKIPDDLSIVTFDEMDASDLFYAPLTYLKQPIQEMGKIATKILLENIDEKKEIVQVKLDAELVIRKSTFAVEGM
ncbi:MAG: substrate-binding domain-containing protein [Bacteroidota bacterium]|nr:substrate-binding domain-containing protein [Bacteroidota bacterium]